MLLAPYKVSANNKILIKNTDIIVLFISHWLLIAETIPEYDLNILINIFIMII